MKKTKVKVYVSRSHIKNNKKFFISDKSSRILIGLKDQVDEYINKHHLKEEYKEYICKNSICDLADYDLAGEYTLRDLWSKEDVCEIKDKITCTVNSHGAKLFKLK